MINFIYHFITYKSNNLIWLIGSNGCKILTCEYYLFKYKVHTVFFERLCNVLSSLKYYFFNYSDLTIFVQHLQYAFYTTSYVQYKITIIPGAIILLFWKEQLQLLIALNSKQTSGQPTMMQWQGPRNIPAVAAKGMKKKKWKWNFNRSEKIPDSINCYQGFFFLEAEFGFSPRDLVQHPLFALHPSWILQAYPLLEGADSLDPLEVHQIWLFCKERPFQSVCFEEFFSQNLSHQLILNLKEINFDVQAWRNMQAGLKQINRKFQIELKQRKNFTPCALVTLSEGQGETCIFWLRTV